MYHNAVMAGESITPFADQGRRLRWLRQAEGFATGSAFADHMRWPQSAISQFETGKRRVPLDKGLQLVKRIAGFDLQWLWTGERRGLSYDLRKRIDAEEAKDRSADCERQDVGC